MVQRPPHVRAFQEANPGTISGTPRKGNGKPLVSCPGSTLDLHVCSGVPKLLGRSLRAKSCEYTGAS